MIPTETCRILPLATASGVANMALDHALLDSIDANPESAALRFYLWSEPTLSLGYFQSLADARIEARWSELPVVRRPSGGGALLHHREITYALVVPRSHPLARRPSDLYRSAHSTIADTLSTKTFVAKRRGNSTRSVTRPFLCFLDHDSEDILVHDVKVVGSAQRRRPNAVLQHGSILLGRSPYTAELPGLQDLVGGEQEANTLVEALAKSIPVSLGMNPIPGAFTGTELAAAKALADLTYSSDTWTDRR